MTLHIAQDLCEAINVISVKEGQVEAIREAMYPMLDRLWGSFPKGKKDVTKELTLVFNHIMRRKGSTSDCEEVVNLAITNSALSYKEGNKWFFTKYLLSAFGIKIQGGQDGITFTRIDGAILLPRIQVQAILTHQTRSFENESPTLTPGDEVMRLLDTLRPAIPVRERRQKKRGTYGNGKSNRTSYN